MLINALQKIIFIFLVYYFIKSVFRLIFPLIKVLFIKWLEKKVKSQGKVRRDWPGATQNSKQTSDQQGQRNSAHSNSQTNHQGDVFEADYKVINEEST